MEKSQRLCKLGVMSQNITINDIKGRVAPLLRDRGVKRSSVFGSCARGEAGADSDVDLLVDLPDTYTLLDVVQLKQELEDLLKRGVDLVEFDAIKPSLRESVLAEQVEIL